jgi:hypothetical protein
MIPPSLKTSVHSLTHLRTFMSSIPLLSRRHKQSIQQQEEIALYDRHNLEACPWPQTPDGQYAQKFLTPLIQRGVSKYIENVHTDMRVLLMDDLVLPITVNNAEYENSYVCSPYSYFISYARESIDFLSQAWLYYAINALLIGAGKVLRQLQINKVVVVNNWLYSTNLYPQIQPHQVTRIAQFLEQAFPDHAIVFRCVDPYTNPICFQTLQKMGLEFIAMRPILFLDPRDSSLVESRIFKSDIKLLKNSGYEIIDGERLTESEIPRLLELYRDLYIQKYSTLNPKFSEDFMCLVLGQKLLQFKALKKDGSIDGVVGYVQRNGKMYCPFFGYDSQVPKERALYRLLSTLLMLEAYHQGLFFHQSSGASMFKKIRKAHSCIEYMAVSYKHLKISRHLPWQILKNLYNSLGTIYMKRY